jgi:protocatechuate 3,4-dioxygenase beta subunit
MMSRKPLHRGALILFVFLLIVVGLAIRLGGSRTANDAVGLVSTTDAPTASAPTDVLPIGDSRPEAGTTVIHPVPIHEPNDEANAVNFSVLVLGRVVDRSGQPVSGARVELHPDPTRGEGAVRDTPVLTQTVTGTGGSFDLGGLVASEAYLLRVEHGDYQVTFFRPVHVLDPSSLHPIVVLDGGTTLTGTVRSEEGTALGAATVTVFQSSDQWPPTALRLERTATTLSDGSFSIPHIAAGVKRVVASKAGYASEVVENHRCLGLPAEAPVKLVLAFSTVIKGHVVDGTRGGPLAGVPIGARVAAVWSPPPGPSEKGETPAFGPRAVPAGSIPRIDPTVAMTMPGPNGAPEVRYAYPEFLRNRAWFDLSTVSRADGTFEFIGVRQADYVLFISDESFSQGTEWAVRAGEENVTLSVASGMLLAGRVIDDETGTAVTPFVIGVGASPEAGLVPTDRRRQVDAPDGRFQVSAPRSAPAYLHIWANGFAGAVSGPFVPGGADRNETIVIAVQRGATLTGLVKDANGIGVAGATVALVDAVPEGGGADAGILFMARRTFGPLAGYRNVTDAAGRFTIVAAPAGRLAVQVQHPEFAETVGPPFVCSGRGAETLSDVTVKRGSSLEGAVLGLQGHTGQLIVRGLWPSAPVRSIAVAPDGKFSCRGLAAGPYQLISMRDGRSDPALFLAQTTSGPKIELHEGEARSGLVLGEEPAAAPARSKE